MSSHVIIKCYFRSLIDTRQPSLLNGGTYAYRKMPFGLTNAGATFQKAMEMAFKSMPKKFVLIYLDDIIVYSKNVEDHFGH